MASSIEPRSFVPSPAGPGDLVQVDRLIQRYRDVEALRDVSFQIRTGEIFGYIGPNGSGKTTTIRRMVGLLRGTGGLVTISGHPLPSELAAVQAMVGYLPQQAAFPDWMTVDQALTTLGRLSGMGRERLATRTPEVLQLLGIAETRHRKILQLSGGTTQKVGLAQAILHEPKLLVLDEPMAGLDPASRYQFKGILRRLRAAGTTIFFSSHILSDVQDVADRFGILKLGRLLHVGTFAELQSRLVIPKVVEVELARDTGRSLDPSVLARLMRLDRPSPNRLLAHVRPDVDLDETIEQLIDGLRAAGFGIRSIRPVIPDLETLYVQFVGGDGA